MKNVHTHLLLRMSRGLFKNAIFHAYIHEATWTVFEGSQVTWSIFEMKWSMHKVAI